MVSSFSLVTTRVTFCAMDGEATEVEVRAAPRPPQRGTMDLRIAGEALDASPHMTATEQLSAAPGVFVDHEDGEGLGNDVYMRGFDFEHGSGIEFRVAGVPVNIPMHVLGQGYADVGFVIPEVVRSIRVVGGIYDPEQGDAAIGGSAYYDLGVVRRGYRLSASYGSFNQRRLVAVVAPPGEPAEDLAAVSVRQTDGFGPGNRASASASTMMQRAWEVARGYRARVSGAAYGVGASLSGVVRADDVDAGKVGYYDTYASPFAAGQSVLSSRGQLGVELEQETEGGGAWRLGAWTAVTKLRLRENFTGSTQASDADPSQSGRGDLLQSTNDEAAFGMNVAWRSAPVSPARWLTVGVEPGISMRSGFGDQGRSLLLPPPRLAEWDRRLDYGLETRDLAGYVDVDLRVARMLPLLALSILPLMNGTFAEALRGARNLRPHRSFRRIMDPA